MIKNIKIDTNSCIGCGNCAETCSSAFRLTRTVYAEPKAGNYQRHSDEILSAYYGCPVNCIEIESDDPSHQITWHTAELIEKKMLSDTVMELRLSVAIEGRYNPGQYVTIRFTDDISTFNRAYSIVDYHDDIMTLCVTLHKEGRGSSCFAHYAVGSHVEITDPKGDFYACETENPKVFIATGSGLAALISMMECYPTTQKTLYFEQRTERQFFYRERLEKIPNLEIHYCLSQAGEDWQGLRGRVADFFESYPLTKETEVYTCGSDTMMNDIEKSLKRRRHPRHLFFRESFLPKQQTSQSTGNLFFKKWIRNIHIYLSLLTSVLVLFFGLTGFMANRPELFDTSSLQNLPANISMGKGELTGFFKTTFGADFTVSHFSQDDGYVSIELAKDKHTRYIIDLNKTDGSYTVTQTMPLPAGATDMDDITLARALAKYLPGKLDEDSIETDGEEIYLNLESVWNRSSITVHRANNEVQINQETIPWIKSLILLHKGKMAGNLQRILMDLAAFALLIVALSGMMMAIQSQVRSVRITAITLVMISIIITLLMVVGR